MWNVDTTISDTLHDGEDLSASASTSQTNIENGSEWILFAFRLNVVVLTIDFVGTLVEFVQIQLLQVTASQQQSSAIGSSVVGQTNLDSIAWQFMGVG